MKITRRYVPIRRCSWCGLDCGGKCNGAIAARKAWAARELRKREASPSQDFGFDALSDDEREKLTYDLFGS
jgi:hypothetical protein